MSGGRRVVAMSHSYYHQKWLISSSKVAGSLSSWGHRVKCKLTIDCGFNVTLEVEEYISIGQVVCCDLIRGTFKSCL